ncbi:MAG: hypothetical protein PHW96_02360 [Candidatus Nanoarchaeia archaeon]|nr:hypothetical protein [Candidatus Nanoarchaeia archaeon]
MSIKSAVKKFLRNGKIRGLLKKSRVGATTDLVLFSIHRNPEALRVYDAVKAIFMQSSHYILGSVGERYISLIVNEHNHDYIVKYFGKYIFAIEKKVACITVHCSETELVPGVITYITSILSDKSVNMHEFFTSQDEIILVIDEEQAFDYVSYLKEIFQA